MPGGYDINRLPITIKPAGSEAARSWLIRTARAYRIHPRALLQELGLDPRPRVNPNLPQMFAARAGRAALRRLGLTWDERPKVSQMAHALWYARRSVFPGTGVQEPLRRHGSRFCPACLSKYGYWPDYWSDPLYLFCLHHNAPLHAECALCGHQPFYDPDWMTSTASVLRCHQRIPNTGAAQRSRRDRCGIRFDHLPQLPEATPTAIAAQRAITGVAILADRGDTTYHVAGIRTTPAIVVEAVMTLVAAACETNTFGLGSCALPRAIEIGHSFLAAPTPAYAHALAQGAGLLREDGTFPSRTTTTQWRTTTNPLLEAIHLRATAEGTSLPHRLTVRLGSQAPRPPNGRPVHPDDDLPALPYGLIPASIDADVFPDIDRLGLNTPRGHRVVRACLARYGSDRPFTSIFNALNIPWRNTKQLTVELVRLQSAGLDRDFLRAVDATFRRLHRRIGDTPDPDLAGRIESE